MPQHFFIDNLASLFFWVCLLHGQSRPHDHDHDFLSLTLINFGVFLYFFIKKNQFHCSTFIFLRVGICVFFSPFFFMELFRSCLHGYEVSRLTLVDSIFLLILFLEYIF